MESQEKLKAELELLEIIEESSLEKSDFFLMHWKNEVVIIMSRRLRSLIKKIYPDVKWLKVDQVSMEDWNMMDETLRACIRN